LTEPALQAAANATADAIQDAARALSDHVLGSKTATGGLYTWCEARGLSSGPITVDLCRDVAPRPLDEECRAELKAGPGEEVIYRLVVLKRGALVLAEADNWFRPRLLTPAMLEALETTDIPFSGVIEPLKPVRRTFGVSFDTPRLGTDYAAEHRAVLAGPDGTPIAVVRERFRADLLRLSAG
jgi:chorismate-pyruvate lyase